MNAREYYERVQTAIRSASYVLSWDVDFDEISVNQCYIRGVLRLVGSYELHIAEYVTTSPILSRDKYRYHLQRSDGVMIVRWDNAPHHRNVHSFPDHRHEADGSVNASDRMDVNGVLELVLPYIMPYRGWDEA